MGGGVKSEQGIVKLSKEAVNLTGNVHLLPCCIKCNSPSPVSQYFIPRPTAIFVEGFPVQEASFRGRKLLGLSLPLPSSYSGMVLCRKTLPEKEACEMSEHNSNCWEINAKSDTITYWNHDTLPSTDDVFPRSFHWLSVAQALHKPVSAEELAAASITLEKSS